MENFKTLVENFDLLNQKVEQIQKKFDAFQHELDLIGSIEIDFVQAENNFNVSRSKLYKDIERGLLTRTENSKLAINDLRKKYQLRSKRWNNNPKVEA